MKKGCLLIFLSLLMAGCNTNSNSSKQNSTAPSNSTSSISSTSPVNSTESSSSSSVQNDEKLMILQVYGVGTPGGTNVPALSHSFIELYNPNDKTISLSGYSIQYSSGESSWSKLALTGNIPASSSYLILANDYGEFGVKEFNNSDADILWTTQTIENKGIKVCLVKSLDTITVVNPFASKIAGYVDMIGAAGKDETIDGFETEFISGQSKQKAVRRISLEDTNNNNNDFALVDYSTLPTGLLENYLPRKSTQGAWNPIPEIEVEEEGLMIFQIYGTGNNTDSAISHSFVELYNPTSTDINLAGYSLQYGNTGTSWTKINLSGKAKAGCSFLILGKRATTVGMTLAIDEARCDLVTTMILDNKVNKICLVSNQNTITIINPFVDKLNGYIDLVGTGATDAYEGGPVTDISKQKSIRRSSLVDTNNNFMDFETIKYNDLNPEGEDMDFYRPKYSGYGVWTPVR